MIVCSEWLVQAVVRHGLQHWNLMTVADMQLATAPGWCGVMIVPHSALAPIKTIVAKMVCSNRLNWP